MQSKHTIQRKKRLGFAGIKLSGSVPCTFIAPRHEINYAHQYPVSGDKSTPTPGGAETRLVSSAVANEGEGAIALTDVTSVKNQFADSASSAIPSDDKVPDKADCRDKSVSLSGFSVDAKEEGEGRTYMAPEPDNADSVLHPVVEKLLRINRIV